MIKIELLEYYEHCGVNKKSVLLKDSEISSLTPKNYEEKFPKTRKGKDISPPCFSIQYLEKDKYSVSTDYFIGLDWVIENKTAIYVAPKLNKQDEEIDFVKMLFASLNNYNISNEIDELYIIKWEKPPIEIEQKYDMLTPFLVMEFLGVLKKIVHKGLRKSYYHVEQNLQSRVKGKVMVGATIKRNILQNKKLHTYCSYEEFGVNNKENRLLKKALTFVRRYLPNYSNIANANHIQNSFNYISPAFAHVSDKIELNEIKHTKVNSFYKDYKEGIRLAKLILRRFGYNITNTSVTKIKTPPFWIDMTKLFEIYTLGLLRERFGNNNVLFQYSPDRNNDLDYLLNTENYKMVIDAKYKKKYISGKEESDMRQVSGYARLKSIYEELYQDKDYNRIIDGLIIYPDQDNGLKKISEEVDILKCNIPEYIKMYKLGIKLPVVKN